MNNVFVVTYQSVLYTEEMYDYKHFMLDPVKIIGVFSTQKNAKDSIKKDMIERFDNDLDYIKEYDINDHYSIYKFKIDDK